MLMLATTRSGKLFDDLAPAKRSQHFNATYRNIVGRKMLLAFGHPIATYCDVLSFVGSNLKMIKFFMQHLTLKVPRVTVNFVS